MRVGGGGGQKSCLQRKEKRSRQRRLRENLKITKGEEVYCFLYIESLLLFPKDFGDWFNYLARIKWKNCKGNQ